MYNDARLEDASEIIITDEKAEIFDIDDVLIIEIDLNNAFLSFEKAEITNRDEEGVESIVLHLASYKVPWYIDAYTKGQIHDSSQIQFPQTDIDIKYDGETDKYIITANMRMTLEDIIPVRGFQYIVDADDLQYGLSKLSCDLHDITPENVDIVGNVYYVISKDNGGMDIHRAFRGSSEIIMRSMTTGDVSSIPYSSLLIPADNIIGKFFLIPETAIIAYGNPSEMEAFFNNKDDEESEDDDEVTEEVENTDEEDAAGDIEEDNSNDEEEEDSDDEDIESEDEDHVEDRDRCMSIIYSTFLVPQDSADVLKAAITKISLLLYKNKDDINGYISEEDIEEFKRLYDIINTERVKEDAYFASIIFVDGTYIYNIDTIVENILFRPE